MYISIIICSFTIAAVSSHSPAPVVTPMVTQASTTINSEKPFPITSSPPIRNGGGGAFGSATPLPIALTVGVLVPLTLIIITLTIAISVLVAVLLNIRQRKDRKTTTISTGPNMAYGVVHREVDNIHMGLLSGTVTTHAYDYPIAPSNNQMNSQSVVYNEAYVQSNFAARNKTFTTDFLDANEIQHE